MFQLLAERGHLALPILVEAAADAELRAGLYQELVRLVVACIEASMQRFPTQVNGSRRIR